MKYDRSLAHCTALAFGGNVQCRRGCGMAVPICVTCCMCLSFTQIELSILQFQGRVCAPVSEVSSLRYLSVTADAKRLRSNTWQTVCMELTQ